ncbi:alpha beta-hydrolase [Athelia psychrophila]|uniref:Alpha beta-hydrolase n=1 Tax=Athelia psychrophila TaxID=1759441 RepID=A0A165ZLD9_9AGAM|nr:alpha beta-hydrolase [Fibularhizoctonia sp. CBS 109695]
MHFSVLSAFALSAPCLAAGVAASIGGAGYDTSRVGPDNADCERVTYKLSIESNNTVFDESYTSNINETVLTRGLQDYVIGLLATSSASNFSAHYEVGGGKEKSRVANTYAISGTLCTPKGGATNKDSVQYLIHGVGFDSSYWDFSVSEEYSYVRASAAAGISTFRYDRLGTGLSEKPADSYNVVQSPTDLAIAQKLLTMLRNGDIGGQKFSKVVGVGHSYGSIQVQALSATLPSALDGIILQGFSVNSTALPVFSAGGVYSIATEVFPDRFSKSELTNGYLVSLAPQTNQFNFYYFPAYTQAAFEYARAREQPVSQAVLITLNDIIQPATSFKGPVHVVTGAKDFVFCLGNCYAVPAGSGKESLLDYVQSLYPVTSKFSTYIPADTGHAANQHISAPETYKEMLAFAKEVFSS